MMSKKHKRTKFLPLILGAMMVLLLVSAASAAVWTDQKDYEPGSTVTIFGDNSDGAGYLPGETVIVDVQGPNGYAAACSAVADDLGAWSCQVTLWEDESAAGEYWYTAVGQSSATEQDGGFTDSTQYRITNLSAPSDVPGATVTAKAKLETRTCGWWGCTVWQPLGGRTMRFSLAYGPWVPATTHYSPDPGWAYANVTVPSSTQSVPLRAEYWYGFLQWVSATYTYKPLSTDTTPPNISYTVTGTLGYGDWYINDITLTWTVIDNESTITSTNGCDQINITTDTPGMAFTCSATSAGGTSTESVTIKRDATAPQINCGAADELWHSDNISILCTAFDPTSGLANSADASFELWTNVDANAEAADAFTDSHNVSDNAGNSATPGPIGGNKVDKKAPEITISSPATTNYILHQVVAADYTCIDSGSGINSCSGPVSSGSSIDTATVGTEYFTVNAADNVGNSATSTVPYNVIYNWAGFFEPVDNIGVNLVRAGRAIPVKFSLNGDQGLYIFMEGWPVSYSIACSEELGDTIEETVTAGNSSLSYDPEADQYIYVWKTDRAWSDSCRMLEIELEDGTIHQAQFSFK